jgi:hypothetical protein
MSAARSAAETLDISAEVQFIAGISTSRET